MLEIILKKPNNNLLMDTKYNEIGEMINVIIV